MAQTQTFPLFHPVHGECVADEATAPERIAAGWTTEVEIEKPDPPVEDPIVVVEDAVVDPPVDKAQAGKKSK